LNIEECLHKAQKICGVGEVTPLKYFKNIIKVAQSVGTTPNEADVTNSNPLPPLVYLNHLSPIVWTY
jgi:hypothetical protein